MDPFPQQVVFALDEQLYTLPLAMVERVVQAVYVTPLPKVSAIVHGVINIQGQIIPVINLRKRFGLPERDIDLSDQFIVAQTSRRKVALAVDTVSGVVECTEQIVTDGKDILPSLEYIGGIIKHENGMLLIHDLDTCLSLDEEHVLDVALQNAA
jgi:purine-binding chemotaxis protein CheW